MEAIYWMIGGVVVLVFLCYVNHTEYKVRMKELEIRSKNDN